MVLHPLPLLWLDVNSSCFDYPVGGAFNRRSTIQALLLFLGIPEEFLFKVFLPDFFVLCLNLEFFDELYDYSFGFCTLGFAHEFSLASISTGLVDFGEKILA